MWLLFDGAKQAVNLNNVVVALWRDQDGGKVLQLVTGTGPGSWLTLKGEDAKLAWRLLEIEAARSAGVAESHR